MSVLSDNYKRIITEIEEKITNPEDLEFVKEKISELSMIFMDIIDNLANNADEKIKQIEEKQRKIEEKMNKVEGAINEIETDIYVEDDSNFDFEIVCPYCDNEFVTTIDGKDEVICPKCNNVIELDWNDEDEEDGCCSGHCHSCHSCEEDDDCDCGCDCEEDDENDEDEDM